jgi:sulfur carrier protein ThiS
MRITVETGKWAERYINGTAAVINLPEQSTVADAIEMLNLPPDHTGIAVIDKKAVPRKHTLSEGDVLKIHPSLIGG